MPIIVDKKSFKSETLYRYNWVRSYVYSFMTIDPTSVISNQPGQE